MKRIWMMMVLTIKDSLRAKVWLPLALMTFMGSIVLVGGFGLRLGQNIFANNILSSYFMFWSWGVIMSTLVLGSVTMPTERRAAVLFTLPITRTEVILGKVLGTQAVATCFLLVGYLVSLRLAAHNDLPLHAYSILGFMTALTLSFIWVCISVPLGTWFSPVTTGTLAFVILFILPSLQEVIAMGWITTLWVVWPVQILSYVLPWQVQTEPLRFTFFDRSSDWLAYAELALNAISAMAVVIALCFPVGRTELSTKS